MKANGYCPILYKKDGTQKEHTKYWGYYYRNEAKDRLGVKKLNCTPSRKQKKPTVICDGDKIILHIPFGFKDDDSDTSEGVLTKYKKYAESSNDGSFAESSDSSDEECGKKRSRKKSPEHKTKQKKANTVIPTSVPFSAPAPLPAPHHSGILVIPESTQLPTTQPIIMPIALDQVGPPTAISIPRASSEDALNRLLSQLEEEIIAQGVSPSAFVFKPSMYHTPVAQ